MYSAGENVENGNFPVAYGNLFWLIDLDRKCTLSIQILNVLALGSGNSLPIIYPTEIPARVGRDTSIQFFTDVKNLNQEKRSK